MSPSDGAIMAVLIVVIGVELAGDGSPQILTMPQRVEIIIATRTLLHAVSSGCWSPWAILSLAR